MKEDLQEIETFEKRLTKSGIRAQGAGRRRKARALPLQDDDRRPPSALPAHIQFHFP